MSTIETNKRHLNIKAMWGVLCTMSSIDQKRNNISLFNVITQLNMSGTDLDKVVPGKHKGIVMTSNHELIVMFRRLGVPGIESAVLSADIKISLVGPSGDVIREDLSTIKFEPNIQTHGHRISYENFVVQSTGLYEYRVSVFEDNTTGFIDLYTIPLSVERTN